MRQGIIDEVDSDTGEHTSTAFRRTIMRNVSIVSATSEDEQQAAMMTSGRDVSVDEIDRKVVFDNGESHIRVTKTVIEEQQLVEVDENGLVGKYILTSDSKKSESKHQASISITKPNELSIEKTIETNEKINTSTLSEQSTAKKAKVWTVESEDEVELPKELTEEEQRRQRIKDIRQRARKGSLHNKEVANEREINENAETVPTEFIINDKALSANVQETHKTTEITVNEESGSYAKTSSEQKVQTAILLQKEEAVEDDDPFMTALLKRGQAQRAALQQILSHEDDSANPDSARLDVNSNEIKRETIEVIENQATTSIKPDENEYEAPRQHQVTVDSGAGTHTYLPNPHSTDTTDTLSAIYYSPNDFTLHDIIKTYQQKKHIEGNTSFNRMIGFRTQHARYSLLPTFFNS